MTPAVTSLVTKQKTSPVRLDNIPSNHVPSPHYVPVASRLTQTKNRPFHPSVYEPRRKKTPRPVNKPGFPGSTRGDTIREWIPGISTPEGVVVSTMALFAMSPDGTDMIIRVAQHAAVIIVTGVTVGFPSLALWVGQVAR